MRNNADFKRFYGKAISYLARRAHSVQEIRNKLKLKESPPEITNAVIERLLELKFLNDNQFAQDFIRYQLSTKPQGEMSLFYKLKAKGVDDSVIKAALKDAFSSKEDTIGLARAALAKKSWSGVPTDKLQQRKYGFLARRGFSYETIRRLIDSDPQKE